MSMPHWHLASLGGAEGTARLDEREVRVTSGSSRRFEVGRTLEIDADSGKFADAEDGFIFCYRMVDPSAENFRISATVTATKSAAGADQQSGCGIMLVDSDTGTDERSCHRNSLLLGRFGRMRTLGVRIVAGHVDRDCFEPSNARILDESRAFPGDGGEAFFGVPKTFSAEKTDEGFVLACDGQRIEVPGCDFLMVQDPSSVCVGFAVARGVRMEIDDIRFEVWSGAASHTPDGAIESSVPDYPFTRSIVADAWAGVSAPGEALPQVCYVAPAGRPEASGSEDDPSQQPSASRWKAGYSCRHANYVVFQTSKVKAMFPQSVREKSCIIHDPVTVSCHATSSCKKSVTMGLPRTSTVRTDSGELIDDGESGLPVPLRDEDTLAEAMECLADDSELRAGLSEAARLRTLEFALEDVIRAWERIL